jgi:hypothetical protein
MSDGSLEFVPTNLRRHIVVNHPYDEPVSPINSKPDDLVWLKLEKSLVEDKNYWKNALKIAGDFKIEIIPEERHSMRELLESFQPQSQQELLDNMIDSLTNTDEFRKKRLKELWKALV